MNQLLGRFYLRLTSNGNLTGEFSNNLSLAVQSESADRNGACPLDLKSPDAYLGEYRSTWVEGTRNRNDENLPIHATLRISRIDDTRIFSLLWIDQNGRVLFRGQGMIGEALLIGDYQQG